MGLFPADLSPELHAYFGASLARVSAWGLGARQSSVRPSRIRVQNHASTSSSVLDPQSATSAAVVFERVTFGFDEHIVLRDVSFTLPRGSMKILLGASGSGKSVLLKLILGLLRPDSGTILVNGYRVSEMSERELLRLRADTGMLFQEGALFDSLTVLENVGYRLYEETDMPLDQVRQRVEHVLEFVGLKDLIDRLPSELSGGQKRRVAIARAMATEPNLLLFDDPTSGLDPIIATTVNDEIVKLRDLQHVTSIVVTHQIRDAFYVAHHEARLESGRVCVRALAEEDEGKASFMVLQGGQICFEGSAAELRTSRDRYLREFLFMTLPPW